MRKYTNNSIFQYALIACLALTLALGQSSKLHMHLEHDDVVSSAISDHKLDVHIATSLHDSTHDNHHQDDFQDHHLADYKVSPDSVVKKIESFTPFILLFLFVSLFLGIPQLRTIFRQHIQTKLTSNYYLLSPPLRAPPIHSPV